jgi:hypothetical protein
MNTFLVVLNMAIIVDVGIVVKVHKFKIIYLPINSKRCRNKQQAHPYITIIDSVHGKLAGLEDFYFALENLVYGLGQSCPVLPWSFVSKITNSKHPAKKTAGRQIPNKLQTTSTKFQ